MIELNLADTVVDAEIFISCPEADSPVRSAKRADGEEAATALNGLLRDFKTIAEWLKLRCKDARTFLQECVWFHYRFRSSTRLSLPVAVFGSASTNSISRGYL